MGGTCSRKKPMRFLIQGLDASGKTSFLYRLKLGEVVTTIPTIGFNVETLQVDGFEIVGWDLGGRDKVRPLYRHYYPNSHGLIYMIDSFDKERLDDALEELSNFVLQVEELANRVVMVLANKQDLEGALSVEELEAKVKDKCTIGFGMSLFVMPCSVVTGEGMWEAFNRFVTLMDEKKIEGKVPLGLIPYTPLPVDQELEENKLDNAQKNVGNSPGLLERVKHSWLKYFFSSG